MGERVAIIGAGIVGAAIAFRLAESGHAVTVIEASAPASGASGRSFGWINASFFNDAAHFRLRSEGIAAWRRLAMPDVRWPGCLWFEEEGDAVDRMAALLREMGYPVEDLDAAAVAQAEPALADPPARALRFAGEGVGEARVATEYLLKQAATHGATLLSGMGAARLTLSGERVTGVETDGGRVEADRVIVAAGGGTPSIVAPAGVRLPMLRRPGLLLTTRPVPARLNHVLAAPGQELRQLPDSRILAPTSPHHQADESEALDQSAETLAEAARDRVSRLLGTEVDIDHVSMGLRPVPEDGLPVIGPAGPDGLYIAVMHSGVTLAAIVGEVVAGEVTTGAPSDLLSGYRPDRFAG